MFDCQLFVVKSSAGYKQPPDNQVWCTAGLWLSSMRKRLSRVWWECASTLRLSELNAGGEKRENEHKSLFNHRTLYPPRFLLSAFVWQPECKGVEFQRLRSFIHVLALTLSIPLTVLLSLSFCSTLWLFFKCKIWPWPNQSGNRL